MRFPTDRMLLEIAASPFGDNADSSVCQIPEKRGVWLSQVEHHGLFVGRFDPLDDAIG